MTSKVALEKKTEQSMLIKNSNGEGEEKMVISQSQKDLAVFCGCIKVSNDQSLQWQSLKKLTVCLCLTVTERELEL